MIGEFVTAEYCNRRATTEVGGVAGRGQRGGGASRLPVYNVQSGSWVQVGEQSPEKGQS